MEDRIDKFGRYTVPSVSGQTEKDFEWILLLDSRTPRKTIIRLKKMIGRIPYRMIIAEWTRGRFKERDCVHGWKQEFAAIAKTECKYAVMTRLDNDDALALGAVERIQRWVQKSRSGQFVIDMPCGVMWDSVNRQAYLARHAKGSPYITLVENTGRKGGLQTVYWHCHRKVAMHEAIVYTPRDWPGWLMVIHKRNTSNRIFKKMIVRKIREREVEKMFGVRL